MELKDLQNKKIAILGLGIENIALVRYLLKHKVKCEMTICDKRGKKQLGENNQRLLRRFASRNDIRWQLGKDYNKNLDKFDVLFRAPGWPIIPLKSPLPPLIKGALTSPMKLFFELCPSKNIIGVTGTKGKGTTASLIYEILKTAGKRVWLGGNIGTAPFEFLDKIKKNDWVALELSSFQLEDLTVSPQIAVIANLYPEHLKPADPNNPNYHKSMAAYFKAKANIFRWQKESDFLISNDQFPISKQIPNSKFQTRSKIIYFKKSNLPSKLVGEHNKENIAAAAAVAKIAGVKNEVIKKAVAGFNGLEHRLELAREYNGVKYYDDSFATTPESTIIALKSFSQSAVISSVSEKSLKGGNKKYKGFLPAVEMTKKPIILLLGGADKRSDFSGLAKEVKKHVKYVVLLNGDSTPRIKKELLKVGFKADSMKLADNIKEAVKFAKAKAAPGDIVLLSTACASFGMFKNYKERGDLFKAEVNLPFPRPKA